MLFYVHHPFGSSLESTESHREKNMFLLRFRFEAPKKHVNKHTQKRTNADGIWHASMIFENDRICMLTVINIPIANHARPPAGLTV